MGRVGSNYYVKVNTMNYFMQHLKPGSSEQSMLYHMANSSEFEQLKARQEEQQELLDIANETQIMDIKKEEVLENYAKVLLLFEAYIRGWELRTFSLIADMQYIVQNCARILRSMFEIALNRNYCQLALIILDWCKFMDKRLDPNAHPLRQFTSMCNVGKLTNASQKAPLQGYMNPHICSKLEMLRITDLETLYSEDEEHLLRKSLSNA